MTWKNAIRQIHRWLSIAFTVTVIANFVVRIWGEPPAWVTYSPLLPLFLLLFSGLYMFVLPYAVRLATLVRKATTTMKTSKSAATKAKAAAFRSVIGGARCSR